MKSSKFQIGDRVLIDMATTGIVVDFYEPINKIKMIKIKTGVHSFFIWRPEEDLTLIQSAIDKLDNIL